MKKTLVRSTLLLLAVFSLNKSSAQNLVLNPGFENRNPNAMGCVGCLPPGGFSQVADVNGCIIDDDDVVDWWDGGGSSDFYFRGGTGGGAVPIGSGSTFFTDGTITQEVATGDAAGGLIAHIQGSSNPNQREYLISKLTSPLIVGQQYGVEFYALLSNNSTFSTDDIGAYFSNGVIDYLNPPPSENALQVYDPTIAFDVQASATVDDVGQWTQICGVFTATVPATHMYIGNVNTLANTTLTARTQTGSSSWDGIYYYIDDVRVTNWTGSAADFCNVALTVDLAELSGKPMPNKNRLFWTTNSEEDHDFFIVERLINNKFEAIAEVASSGHQSGPHSYQIDHSFPEERENYRLKYVDVNGTVTYSKSILVQRESLKESNFRLFPNPAAKELFLETNTLDGGSFKVLYSNLLGVTESYLLQVSPGKGRCEIVGFEELEAGIYFFQIVTENGRVVLGQKILKQ